MEKVGIICEYNPFHNGHIYHLKKIKELFPDSLIILVMSGNYTMRGEISLLNKWDKTSIALKYGVSLVVELPCFYATNSADTFSEGAINILNKLQCDYVVFGSECNDINLLSTLAHTQIENPLYDKLVNKYMQEGHNYPTSMAKALQDLCGKTINMPNDLLGLSYIKQIILQKAKIIPYSILRTNDYHETKIKKEITSATSIREAIKMKQDIKKNVPKETLTSIITDDYQDNLFKLLKYQCLNNFNNLSSYLDVDEGLDNLIRKNILKATNYDDLINKMKTKRYTYNRLNRMFIHILLNIQKNDVKKRKEINYLRVLGFDKLGREYLKKIKKECPIPIITKYSDINDDNLTFELHTAFIYHMIINNPNLNITELKSIPKRKED